MLRRGQAGGVALVVGGFVTMLAIARASASSELWESDLPLVRCVLNDGDPCDAGVLEDADTDAAAADGSSNEDGGVGASFADAGADAGSADASGFDGAPEDTSTSGGAGSSGGCGCHVAGRESSGAGPLLGLLSAVAVLGARRSRRRR
jgi:hypothetical protein